jgi:pyridoxal phosphate enzyme (YggS family)
MSIAENLQNVNETIATACAKVNRNPDDVTLIAVSKRKPAADILEAIQAGQRHFGENRLEESAIKIPEVNGQIASPVTWHMIGHIQSRKAKLVPSLFDVIHSVDRLKIAQKLSQLAVEQGQMLDVLLECNVSGEEAKSGFNGYNWGTDLAVKETLWQAVDAIVALPNLRVRGLMTMAPFVDDADVVRRVFADLYALRESLQLAFSIEMPELSMGMTNDYAIAIEEGATMVRVGRAIFGEREY